MVGTVAHDRPTALSLDTGRQAGKLALVYVELRRGDRLPIVAYAQWLLGQHPAVARTSLPVDGLRNQVGNQSAAVL